MLQIMSWTGRKMKEEMSQLDIFLNLLLVGLEGSIQSIIPTSLHKISHPP